MLKTEKKKKKEMKKKRGNAKHFHMFKLVSLSTFLYQ